MVQSRMSQTWHRLANAYLLEYSRLSGGGEYGSFGDDGDIAVDEKEGKGEGNS